ncbi:MAG: hypothetical protein QOE20_2813, partial [Mycobacterium sp.]|nr:hypothetical protein [Mycobacterium sp.]
MRNAVTQVYYEDVQPGDELPT